MTETDKRRLAGPSAGRPIGRTNGALISNELVPENDYQRHHGLARPASSTAAHASGAPGGTGDPGSLVCWGCRRLSSPRQLELHREGA